MRSFRVYIGEQSEWWNEVREDIGYGVQACCKLSPDLEFTYLAHPDGADLHILHWDSEANGAALGAGQFTILNGMAIAQIDPVGCRGRLERRTAVTHEVMHFLGCGHIPRSKGRAVMNPTIDDPDVEIGFDTVEFGVAVVDPTSLDIAEYMRVLRAGLVPIPRNVD